MSRHREAVQSRDGRHTYLAWSADGRVSFASGLFPVGPRNGRQHRYAVRFGVDALGLATGGCCLFTDRAEAERCFLEHARARGGTLSDPDSIDVT